MESNPIISFLPLVVLILVFYFLVFRPQQQQRKRHSEMVQSLKRGDKIVTNGGFVCEVVKQEDKFITVLLGDNQVRLSKDYVGYKIDDINDSEEVESKDEGKKDSK
ncbi:preprotein translocase subunit YajC [Helicobacter saguini]|uniref:Sec translocon accessory complex subunit YajC n=1 Tax=Helicobacter saguini TaxID=1548018 RepID=A0A347VRI2_9HELI|nr:preprotein translocase subunit YajC [Helicobacter saguini]MWV62891.1 preprotein translocase subunit YajC [Helicobacter saguini]MWV66439.1 preprotein translocase subunit YajC [Helicobacter saguini]MWV68789.1 preprotein translocase subunit YajC [Helicobacter saguini]MWV71656.1 preprotein translocase subunit YajC [Helicobacter saguini]TLD94458.1 preprotein translocase subunit YajC [Helicobacter saguini]